MHAPSTAIHVKPLLRGVLHQYGFFLSLLTGFFLVHSTQSARGTLAALVYSLSLSALLGVSALYHRVQWRPRQPLWMRRLDHSMIFVLIAGSYTPFCLSGSVGPHSSQFLLVVWSVAAAGVCLKLVWPKGPRWVTSGTYVAMGWLGVVTFPALVSAVGWTGTGLLVLGGLFYTVGAVIYALKRPNPFPGVFGSHELFHALVLAGAASHYLAIAIYVLPIPQ